MIAAVFSVMSLFPQVPGRPTRLAMSPVVKRREDMNIEFVGLPSNQVAQIRTTMRDAYGLPVETHRAEIDGLPCRHCMAFPDKGRDFLILAHRPFEGQNAYTETGPIFLCADECTAPARSSKLPDFLQSAEYIVRGYTVDERISYGTGQVTPTAQIAEYAQKLLSNPKIAFVDVRSAENNCYHCRIRRAP
jgi:uncharacterized protein DUF1203